MNGDIVRDWIMGLTTAAVVAACAQLLTPKGSVERVTRFICSLMLTAALLSPLVKLDPDSLSLSADAYRQTLAEVTSDLENKQNRLLQTHIEERYAAYILDEALVLGIAGAKAEVKAYRTDGQWLPEGVCLTMTVTTEQKQKLSSWITQQMGIPTERQQWNDA